MRISKHAIERWRERTGSKQSDVKCENSIKKLVARGTEIQPRNPAMTLLNHRFMESKYYSRSGFVAVVRGITVVTVLPPNKSMFKYGSK